MPTNYIVSVDLPQYGKITADLQYFIGFSGSYWEPPDTDEILVNSLKNEYGEEINLSDEEWEDHYNLFLEKAGEAHSDRMNKYYEKYAKEIEEESLLTSLPY
jgi:hypothetical protein